jgi:hypothetical protein
MEKSEARKQLKKYRGYMIELKRLNSLQKINYKTFMVNSIIIETKITEFEENINECNKKRI